MVIWNIFTDPLSEYIVHHVRKAVAAAARCRHLRAQPLH